MTEPDQLNALLKKIEDFKEKDKIDLSSKEDLGVAVMNLISIEEHLFYTYEKTGKETYLSLLHDIREMRKKYLAQIVKNPEGEIWCISKHLLASSMRFMEVATKKLTENKKDEAKDLFDKAYDLWNIFWGINLNLLDLKDVPAREETNAGQSINLTKEKKISVFDNLGKAVQKILDCCRE